MYRVPSQPFGRDSIRRSVSATIAALALAAAWLLGPAAPSALACSNETHCADVGISGHAEPQPIRKGETSELKITPKNNGPSPAYGIDVHVNIPRQLKIKRVRVFGGRNGCSVDGTFVRCDMGDYKREQLGVIRIKVKGRRIGTFVSKARVYSQGVADPNRRNGQVGISIKVKPPTAAQRCQRAKNRLDKAKRRHARRSTADTRKAKRRARRAVRKRC